MRTTLDIDDDLLAAAKELVWREGAAAGGFVPFPPKPGVMTTNEQVDALRDAEGL